MRRQGLRGGVLVSSFGSLVARKAESARERGAVRQATTPFTTMRGETVVRVEVAAPGLDIATTDPGGGYGYAYGTSMAAPFVSGLAGLILSSGRCSSAVEKNACVRDRIQDRADPISGTGDLWRYGRINAQRSMSE